MMLMIVAAVCLNARAAHHEKTEVVFVAGPKSHGYFAHEHNAGSLLLAKALNESGLGIEAKVYYDPAGWPTDPKAFDGADAIVIYCDGGGRHVANSHVKQIDKLQEGGAGVVCLHYGVETIDGEPGDGFLRWMGGYYQLWKSVNPHWTPHFE
ncbi:MAG: PVC-type heme-binding CxxCH protein, partial [Planctomycetota bacterium]